jgi:hypothetical protein
MTNINTFQGDVFIHEYIKHTGDDNNLFGFSGTDTFKIATAGTDRLTVAANGTVTVAGTLTAGGFSGSDISTGTVAAARVATLNQNTTGSAATLTTARTIGGVSFNGSAAIDLPGVNTAGNQATSGLAATATKVQVSRSDSSDTANYLVFAPYATAQQHNLQMDSALIYDNTNNRLRLAQVMFGDQNVYGLGAVTGDYGTVQTIGTGKNSWEGYSINGQWVFMSDGAADSGIYNDTNNAWMTKWNQNGSTDLYYNGGNKFQTTNDGAHTTGIMYADSFSGSAANLTSFPTLNQNTTGSAGSVSTSVTPGSYITGSAYNGATARTFAVDATTASNANKIVARDANAHIYGNYINGSYMNMSHSSANRNSDSIFYSSTDDYIRKTTASGMRNSLGLANSATITGSTGATANQIVVRNSSAYIWAQELYTSWVTNDGGDNNTYFGFPANDTFAVYTSAVERMRITSQGLCGHRLTNPDAPLVIKQSDNGATGGLELIRSNANSGWQIAVDSGNDLQFWYNGTGRGYLLDNGSNGRLNFTGQHRTFIEGIPFTNATNYEGLIVSADQNKYIKMSGGVETGSNAITINESLPIVSITKVEKDKKCFGVVSLSEDPESRQEQYGNFMSILQKELGDTRVYMNSVGEGALWVINNNGSLESGDYITSSNVAGYGQKQDDDILHNYTVAKLTMDCDFNPSTQPIKQFRRELSNVNHYIKTTLVTVTEEEYLNITEEERTTETEIYYTNGEAEKNITKYNNLDSDEKLAWTEGTRTIYKRIERKELAIHADNYDIEVRQELVNVLDEHGQFQLDSHPTETEKAYKIRYLEANGVITDEANAVHIAAFVGCTYHCG